MPSGDFVHACLRVSCQYVPIGSIPEFVGNRLMPPINPFIGGIVGARRQTSRGGVLVTEQCLVEGVNARVESGDIGAHFLAEGSDVLAHFGRILAQ